MLQKNVKNPNFHYLELKTNLQGES